MIDLKTWLPAAGDETYKYTSFRSVARRGYAPPAPVTVVADTLPARLGERLLFLNGRYIAEDGVALGEPRFTVVTGAPDRATDGTTALHIMNTALATERLTLRIAAGVDAGIIELLFLASEHDDRYASHPQVHIEVGAGAQVTIVEHHHALGQAADFINLVMELSVGQGATVDWICLQQAAELAILATGLHATLESKALFRSHAVQLGGGLVRADIGVRLKGAGARCELDGLHHGSGRQHHDTQTRIDHLVPDTSSLERYRMVADQASRSVFNGKVIVHPGADRTDARQSNANLLLSDKAEIDTKPELQIHADEVTCSHGATVGHLDEEMAFYLRSRGIPAETARSVLVWAFMDTILSSIPVATLRQRAEDAAFARLPDAERIGEFR